MHRHKNHRIVEPNYAAELELAWLAIENAENEGWPPARAAVNAARRAPAFKVENGGVRAIDFDPMVLKKIR